jgi:hypothetical protein
MRTTVTLEPDVERLIRDAMREKSISFNEALNQAARLGLGGGSAGNGGKFEQATFRMGQAAEIRWDKALALADAIADQELTRKLELCK